MADFTWSSFKEQQEYLRERGIDEFTTRKLELEVVSPTKLKDLGFAMRSGVQRAILFPIFDVSREIVGYGARLFYQKTFGKDSRAKFLHPPNQSRKKPPSLYFSPLVRWDKLEYGQRVFICESYLKANILCMLGFHAIGVSGCWGWSHNAELHWSLSEWDWRGQGLRPTLFMDSNVNPEMPALWSAAKRFQVKMQVECNVQTDIILLPQDPKENDWGIDDYYVHHGKDKLLKLIEDEEYCQPIPSEIDAHLVQLNSEVCIIRDVGKFADIKRNVLMGRGQFEDVNYADRYAMSKEGKMVAVAKAWTHWDKRNIVDTLRYRPGEERVVAGKASPSYFNLWCGWGCEPLAGDVSLFTEWVGDAFPVASDRNYFLDWWAYQLQYPGAKLNVCIVLVGASGVGKGWMAAIAERIFGHDNTWKCSLSDLESKFNAGLGAAQLLIIEEADVAGGVKVYNTLKDIITNEHLRYERKGVDAVKIENCLNIFINSNHIEVLALDEFDRRFAVLEITNKSIANDAKYWEPRWEWIREGGAAPIFGYLLSRDVEKHGFSPYGEAPWSTAKSDMIESTHMPIDLWVSEHVVGQEEIVVRGSTVDGLLMSAKELAWCYYDGQVPWQEITRKQSMSMVRALNSARVAVANGGKKIKYNRLPSKYYHLSNVFDTSNWQLVLDDRLFWKRLVASMENKVANDKGVATGNPKY